MSDVEITAVRDAHKFDEVALGNYLQANVDEINGDVTVRQFEGGQSNPTYQLVTPRERYVLRRKPPGKLLRSAHAVDREYRVIHALEDSPVPVPRAVHLCTDRDVLGSLFFLMSYHPGRIFWDPTLPGLSADERGAIYAEMNRVLAALHDVDVNAAGLEDFGRPGNYIARQIARWSKQFSSPSKPP